MQLLMTMYFAMLAISGLLSVWRFRRLDPAYLRLIPVSIFLVIVKETGGHLVRYYLGPNPWWFNLFVPLDYATLALLYLFYFRTRPVQVYTIVSIGIVTVLSFVLYSNAELNKYTTLLGNVFLLPLILLYYWNLLRRPEALPLSREPMFWASSGLLFYQAGSIGLFMALNYYLNIHLPLYAQNCIAAMLILSCVMYVFFIVAILCRINKPS